MRVLDVGANIGYYTLLAARAGAQVHAFEPDPRNLHYLLRNLRGNRLLDRVTMVNKAVSDKVGVEAFHQHESLLESSLCRQLANGASTTVECTTIDEYCGTDGQADLIKIDIEGAELRALSGMGELIARSGRGLVMFIECYPAGLKAAGASGEELLKWLTSRGFSVKAIDEKTWSLQQLDLINLNSPCLGGESVRAFNLYCSRE